jgi:hypothetical protein
MSKKDSDSPIDEEARLQEAVSLVEQEVALFKNWMASELGQRSRAAKPLGSARASAQPYNPDSIRASDGQSIVLLERALSQLKWRSFVGIIAVIIAVVVAAVGITINSQRNAESLIQQIQLNRLEITEPPDGARVSSGQTVRGNTPFPYLNHYLMVTAIRTGNTNLLPTTVNPDGTFSGEVRFADPASDMTTGEDDEYTVRVLATKQQLSPGRLASSPDDASIAKPITVRRSKANKQVMITVPVGGATVGLEERVSGTTPFSDLNHYIIVTPLKVGTPYVQAQPATVSNGTFNGQARLGGTSVGVDDQFSIQIVATKAILAPGPLNKPPEDAVKSNSVNVIRK